MNNRFAELSNFLTEMKSILIIEDEFALRHTLALILRRAGYQVATATESQEILPLLTQNFYDLIFIDSNSIQPGPARMITEIRLLAPELPILLLTSNIHSSKSVRGLTAIAKPVDPERVLRTIHDQIGT
jgi:DNA-binding response OmpR family regulator